MKAVARTASALLTAAALAAPAAAGARDPLATFDTAPRPSGARGDDGMRPAGGRPEGAEAVDEPVRLVLQLGADFGQTEAVTLYLSDGSTKSLKYNQGVSLGVGASVPLYRDLLAVQATLGFEYSSVQASNVTFTWTTFPMELLGLVNLYPLRIGVGVSYLFAPTIRASGDAYGEVRFDNSLGLLLEGDLIFRSEDSARRPAWWLGVRYEAQDVRYEGVTDSANAVGIVLGSAL